MSQFTVVVPYQFFFSKKSNSVKNKRLILYAKLNETLLLNEVSCLKEGSEMTDFCLKQGKGLGSLYVPGKLPTYPSPKPTFCPKWEVSVNLCLGEE